MTLVALTHGAPGRHPSGPEIWEHYGSRGRRSRSSSRRRCFVTIRLSGGSASGPVWSRLGLQFGRSLGSLLGPGRFSCTFVSPFTPFHLSCFADWSRAHVDRSIVFETHALPKQAHRWVISNVDLVVTNSSKLARDIRESFRLPANRVIHSPLGPYNQVRPQPKNAARTALALDKSVRIAAYVGKLNEEISEFLLQTAGYSPIELTRSSC